LGLLRSAWCTTKMPFRRTRVWLERTQPWRVELAACQEEVARLDPADSYLCGFRQTELGYWHEIARWICNDRDALRGARILDIGCGHGTLLLYTKRLTSCEAYCTAPFGAMPSGALITAHGLRFAAHNIELGPLPWALRFDAILFTEVLEHLRFAPVPTLARIRGLLAEGGRLYLSTPDAREWGRVTKYYPALDAIPPAPPGFSGAPIRDHIWQYSRAELMRVLEESGFQVVRFAYAPGAGFARHLNVMAQAAPR
jgi:SAM-dependent methyltransferase